MMYPDIEKAIQLIDAKILELQKAKQTLIEAFGGNVNLIPNIKVKPQIIRRRKHTRKDAVIKLLKNEGPLSRGEILNKSGIPKGTIASILNEKGTFISKDGKWNLINKKDSAPHMDEAESQDEIGGVPERSNGSDL